MRHNQLWSLWDMMKLFAPSVVNGCFNMGLMSERFIDCAQSNVGDVLIEMEMWKGLAESVVGIQVLVTENLSLVSSQAQSERVLDLMRTGFALHESGKILAKPRELMRLGQGLHHLSVNLSDETQRMAFVAARRGDSELLKDGVRPFGEEVADAFPSAIYDIEEAACCRALYRWTACVMHLMRALEPALLAFQTAVGVNVPKENWQDILNQIDAAIKAKGHKHPDHAWNSEASLQFLRFKDAWRNYAMHGKERYDEKRALAIYESVSHFMQHLATRLKEQS